MIHNKEHNSYSSSKGRGRRRMRDMWARLGSVVADLMFVGPMFQQYFPHHLWVCIERYYHRLVNFFNPSIQITFHEFSGKHFKRSAAYTAIENYLGTISTKQAKMLKADVVSKRQSLVFSMDDHEEVLEVFKGVKLLWVSKKAVPKTQSISFYPVDDEKRYYMLTFHKRYREMVTGFYLNYVLEGGKAIEFRNRQRKLYTNSSGENQSGYKRTMWNHVVFEHPAIFQTLAMDSEKKEIMDDLVAFSKAKEYYARIGKAWKRGYLLYGPPGTGKSTMIAAIANFLNYDIYDLELTAVKDNTELRKLLIETSSKSIIVIEDIDCSLDLAGKRKNKKEKDDRQQEKDPIQKQEEEEYERKSSKVTLSGLLNFIDGLWSSCGGERLIIFTTNYVERLDPALIRTGRMDKHIELLYCEFEAFKVLAKNYLDLDSHHLFGTIHHLLEEINMTPADVAENLMPKTITGYAETCLESLIEALKIAKEKSRLKAKEEVKLKATKGAKEKESSAKQNWK